MTARPAIPAAIAGSVVTAIPGDHGGGDAGGSDGGGDDGGGGDGGGGGGGD